MNILDGFGETERQHGGKIILQGMVQRRQVPPGRGVYPTPDIARLAPTRCRLKTHQTLLHKMHAQGATETQEHIDPPRGQNASSHIVRGDANTRLNTFQRSALTDRA